MLRERVLRRLALLPQVILIALPLLALAVSAPGSPAQELIHPRLLPLLAARSAGVALTATVAALAIGCAGGWLVGLRRLSPARVWLALFCAPLLLPPYVSLIGWSFLSERMGLPGGLLGVARTPNAFLNEAALVTLAGAVLGASYSPLVLLAVWFAISSSPASLLETAEIETSRPRARLAVLLPQILPAAAAGSLAVVVLALADFSVPNSLGLVTLPVAVVNEYAATYRPSAALRVGWPLLAITVPLVLAVVWLVRRVLAPTACVEFRDRGRTDPASAMIGILCCGCWLLPAAGLLLASLPLTTYLDVWRESADHFGSTLLLASAAALLSPLLAAAVLIPGRGLAPRGSELLVTLPLALPASLIAAGLASLLNRAGAAGEIYDSPLVLVWAYAVLTLPFAWHILQPAAARIDAEVAAQCRLDGARGWSFIRGAILPAMGRPLAAASAVCGLLAAREMDATALLRPPGTDTIAFRIHDYLHYGSSPQVAALGVLLLVPGLAAAALLAAADRLRQRRPRGQALEAEGR